MDEDETLSQDEINTLLGSIEGDGEAEGDGYASESDDATNDGPTLKILDLYRPDIFTRDGVGRMNAYVSRWAEEIGQAMTFRFGVSCEVEAESIDLLTYDEYVRTVPNPGTFVRVRGERYETFGIEATQPVTIALVRAALGYPPNGAFGTVASLHRKIAASALEVVAVSPMMNGLFLRPERTPDIEYIEDPALLSLTDSYDMIVAVAFSVSMARTDADNTEAEEVGRINVCLPSYIVDRMVEGDRRDERSETDEDASPIRTGTTYRGSLEFAIPGVTMEKLSELITTGETTISVADVSGALRFYTSNGEVE